MDDNTLFIPKPPVKRIMKLNEEVKRDVIYEIHIVLNLK